MNAEKRSGLVRFTASAATVLALDQFVKVVVRAGVDSGSTHPLLPGLDLVNIRNNGVAFGLLAGSGDLLIVLTVAVLVMIGIYFAREPGFSRFAVSLGMVLGGAVGNLVDRVANGAVTDYLDPTLWPAFNFADAAIVLGVIGLVYEAAVRPKRPLEQGEQERA